MPILCTVLVPVPIQWSWDFFSWNGNSFAKMSYNFDFHFLAFLRMRHFFFALVQTNAKETRVVNRCKSMYLDPTARVDGYWVQPQLLDPDPKT